MQDCWHPKWDLGLGGKVWGVKVANSSPHLVKVDKQGEYQGLYIVPLDFIQLRLIGASIRTSEG